MNHRGYNKNNASQFPWKTQLQYRIVNYSTHSVIKEKHLIPDNLLWGFQEIKMTLLSIPHERCNWFMNTRRHLTVATIFLGNSVVIVMLQNAQQRKQRFITLRRALSNYWQIKYSDFPWSRRLIFVFTEACHYVLSSPYSSYLICLRYISLLSRHLYQSRASDLSSLAF
jgi:hypothetical protein